MEIKDESWKCQSEALSKTNSVTLIQQDRDNSSCTFVRWQHLLLSSQEFLGNFMQAHHTRDAIDRRLCFDCCTFHMMDNTGWSSPVVIFSRTAFSIDDKWILFDCKHKSFSDKKTLALIRQFPLVASDFATELCLCEKSLSATLVSKRFVDTILGGNAKKNLRLSAHYCKDQPIICPPMV